MEQPVFGLEVKFLPHIDLELQIMCQLSMVRHGLTD
jgi:hypothetical protein